MPFALNEFFTFIDSFGDVVVEQPRWCFNLHIANVIIIFAPICTIQTTYSPPPYGKRSLLPFKRMLTCIVYIYLFFRDVSADIHVNDDGPFKVFRIVPTNEHQLKRIINLFESAKSEEVDFWHAPSVVNSTVDVMVSPSFKEKFVNFLNQHRYPFNVAIEDLNKNNMKSDIKRKLNLSVMKCKGYVDKIKILLIEKEGAIEMNTKGLHDHDFVRLHDTSGSFVSKLKHWPVENTNQEKKKKKGNFRLSLPC
ncbi:carboxypeptidase activation peptide [Dictyocaulus viviparus]|uniref:Zinc carboxypeptidase A 1 n=1 Tax=Dictyocaulus viviparus TaxID=29172 RepID=A0A0D8XJF0_DICVI|nr:carboxypeptidase activation peptide [Dictyocaulus viviparus]